MKRNKYKWALFDKPGSITGFYFEKPVDSLVIMRLGVTRDGNCKSRESPNLQYLVCDAPYLPSVGPNAGLFLSVAALLTLRKVELCRLGSRCTGMRIHYLRAPPVVLGQWHTSPPYHTYIYSKGLNACEIYFRMAKSGGHQVVTDISFSADKSDDRNRRCFSTAKVRFKLTHVVKC